MKNTHFTEPFTQEDEMFMLRAIQLAQQAANYHEVPVGAVVVSNNEIIGEAHNAPISLNDPTGHAEILALRAAAKKIANYRLVGATLYVTLEPCIMCAGALVHARITRLVYGAPDHKAGAVQSMAQTLDHPFLNHRISYGGGLFKERCGELLSEFFQIKRK